jgi:hypothetical protein
LLFGIGSLLFFGYVAIFKSRTKNSKRFNARFRYLFVRFRDERLYWEMIIILRKLAISAAIIFFSTSPILVILFSMFVIFCAFILQTHNVPYRRKFHNYMEYSVLLSTEFLLFSALLFYVNNFPALGWIDALGIFKIKFRIYMHWFDCHLNNYHCDFGSIRFFFTIY